MARYGIASLLGSYPDNYEFTEADTPLHLTHIDALEIDFTPEKFIEMLRQHLRHQPPFEVMPTVDTFFGPNQDIPVTVVELNPELKLFHDDLTRFLESNGAAFENPHYLKENYHPHISIYGSRRVPLGIPITVKSVSIGHKRTDINNPPGRIIATVQLS